MPDATEFIQHILSHGESRYDPVKAREYYLRTRELKGRSRSALRTNSKKEGWDYVKNKVENEKKQAFEQAAERNKQAVTQLRQGVQGRREEIREKLRAFMERLSADTTKERERIAAETKAAIDALPEMPAGLSKEQAAEFRAKRAEEVARIRGESRRRRGDLATSTKEARKGQQEDAAAQREKLTNDLKGSLDQARETYKSAREKIKAKYESELDREYESIRANV